MEEMEMLARAKMYMDKLANGINPITDEEVAEDDAINNVRLSRCFFYVADVLQKVIENGGTEKKRRATKPPFSITEEQLAGYPYSSTPLSITHIVERINNLVDLNKMEKLTYRAITAWLREMGLLEDADGRYGKAKTCPSESGIGVGISVEKRSGRDGEYYAVVYNREAQEFIINHLQSIIDTKENRG